MSVKRKTKEDFIRYTETGYMKSLENACVDCPARKMWNACGRKKKFNNLKEAEKFIKENKLEGFHSYKCEYCNKHHIGHKKPKRSKINYRGR